MRGWPEDRAPVANDRFTPVKVDLRHPVTGRLIVKWSLVGTGLVLFVFGFLGAATGNTLPAMRLHVPAELVGMTLGVLGLMVRTRPR
jgi:hypothetical protein